MIQNFHLNIKSILNVQHFNLLSSLSSDEFEALELYCTNSLNHSSCHVHYYKSGAMECLSPNLTFNQNYKRSYITFSNNQIINTEVTIPVFHCENCGHFHAVLPNFLIIPNCQFSFSFILKVLFDKFYTRLTVEDLILKYQISVSTLYRWIDRYKKYITIYIHLKNQYLYSMFISLLYIPYEIITEIFDTTGFTLFQYERKLHHP